MQDKRISLPSLRHLLNDLAADSQASNNGLRWLPHQPSVSKELEQWDNSRGRTTDKPDQNIPSRFSRQTEFPPEIWNRVPLKQAPYPNDTCGCQCSYPPRRHEFVTRSPPLQRAPQAARFHRRATSAAAYLDTTPMPQSMHHPPDWQLIDDMACMHIIPSPPPFAFSAHQQMRHHYQDQIHRQSEPILHRTHKRSHTTSGYPLPQNYIFPPRQPLPQRKPQKALEGPHHRYHCNLCPKTFSRPSSLRIHGYSHTGEKPHGCPYPGCGRWFSVQSNMRRHLRVHHCSPHELNREPAGGSSEEEEEEEWMAIGQPHA